MIDENLDLRYYHPEKDIYSDGNIENELLDAIQTGKEKELLENDYRWPVLYHLSSERENILCWYPFKKKAHLLEIGCGCGALTGLFTQKVQFVEAIESSKRRAFITKERYRQQKDKLLIHVGEFNEIAQNLTKNYDYVTLIGVLEYAPMFMPNSLNPFEMMLKKCNELLCPGGQLILAIENRLGAKYFAGAGEDHIGQRFVGIENYPEKTKVRTFSRWDLLTLLVKSGFQQADIEWYYPYPDYKFAMQIFSDEHLPLPTDLYADIEVLDTNQTKFFDERRFLQSVSPKAFPIFSNSFLVIARKGN